MITRHRSNLLVALLAVAVLAPVAHAADAPAGVGTLAQEQVIVYGGHLPYARFRVDQALARVGQVLVAIGPTDGGMETDSYGPARAYRIGSDGRLTFLQELPMAARALAAQDGVVSAIAFDRTDLATWSPDDGEPPFSEDTRTHFEAFTLDADGTAHVVLQRKSPLEYTRFISDLAPVPNGLLVVEPNRGEGPGPGVRVQLLAAGADRIVASHDAPDAGGLTSNGELAAVDEPGGRVRLLDVSRGLEPRGEVRIPGIAKLRLDGHTLYAYAGKPNRVVALDVSHPEAIRELWSREVPEVPDVAGLVVDGTRILVHGRGLLELAADGSGAVTYFRPGGRWKVLSSIVPAGEVIYAFNGAGSLSKIVVLRLVRPG